MQIDDEEYESRNIEASDSNQLLPEATERTKEIAMLDEENKSSCKNLCSGDIVDNYYELKDDILFWKNRVYAPKEMRQRIMKSEHDSKFAVHFGRERTMLIIARIFYWRKMEMDLWKYCKECDNCQRSKCPWHAKHGLLHLFEMACTPWAHIGTDFKNMLPESKEATMISVVVDRVTNMPHFILMKKQDPPTVAMAYLENVWNYHGFPKNVVSDRDGTFTG